MNDTLDQIKKQAVKMGKTLAKSFTDKKETILAYNDEDAVYTGSKKDYDEFLETMQTNTADFVARQPAAEEKESHKNYTTLIADKINQITTAVEEKFVREERRLKTNIEQPLSSLSADIDKLCSRVDTLAAEHNAASGQNADYFASLSNRLSEIQERLSSEFSQSSENISAMTGSISKISEQLKDIQASIDKLTASQNTINENLLDIRSAQSMQNSSISLFSKRLDAINLKILIWFIILTVLSVSTAVCSIFMLFFK